MPLSDISILLVDDDPAICEIISVQLELYRVTAKTCTSFTDAIKYLTLETYDAVITDYRLSPQSGLDVLQFVKAHNPRTPVILLTGFADFDHAHAFHLGAEAVLEKPIAIEKLVKNLEELLTKKNCN